MSFSFLSKIIHLQGSYICWLDGIRLGSSNNTGVSKEKSHTPKTQRKIVSMKISDTTPFLKQFYQPLPFYGKKSEPPFFSKILKTQLPPIPSPPL